MKKYLYKLHILLLALFGLALSAAAQPKHYTVLFYNVENLFDTLKTPGVFDDEFTPAGAKKWNSDKYWKKMKRMEEVFYAVASETKDYPTIIGLAEIENRNVLEDIVALEKMQRANYQFVYYQSPEARGINVSLLYRPDQFKYEGSKPIAMTIADEPNFKTRDILAVWGRIEGEHFCFFVNHWPSRTGGEQASEYKRLAAAGHVRHFADSIMRVFPDIKIVIMGDMNDDPTNKSLYEVLGAKGSDKNVPNTGFFNPYHEMFKKGFGTLAYNDAWNLFDNIIVNGNLLNASTGSLKLKKANRARYYGNIFDRPFLRQRSGRYKNYPWRTYVGNDFQNGYSDHFPVFIHIAK